jgi:hypothetical protein
MGERHANIVAVMTGRIADRLRHLDPDSIPLGALPHWLDIAVRVERLARGEPDSIVEDRQMVEQVDALDHELQALVNHARAQRAAEDAGSG